MRVMPVIDLSAGQVVRGVAGRRAEYRPLTDGLGGSAGPAQVAAALVEQFGFREGYLADLDAIGGAEPAWDIYARVQQAGLRLWVDAGVHNAAGARRLAEFGGGCVTVIKRHSLEREDTAGQASSDTQGGDTGGASPTRTEVQGHSGDARTRSLAEPVPHNGLAGIVLGLETIAGPAALAACVSAVGAERAMFSLDLREGVPLAGDAAWRRLSVRQIAAAAVEAGVRRAIVLDLARVGVGGGVGTEGLLQELATAYPQVAWWAGGGVRGPKDLRRLAACGATGALVASALHDGRLTAGDVRPSVADRGR